VGVRGGLLVAMVEGGVSYDERDERRFSGVSGVVCEGLWSDGEG
jgi:hypothetical protein